ncbi:MAG: PrsW family glutamic-type intramembrane protease [Bacteroidota bacterium]
MYLLIIALAPIFIIASYIYYRDKYEKEPLWLLFISLVAGGLIIIPVVFIELFFTEFLTYISYKFHAIYTAFIVAGFTEELFKYMAVLLLIWKNKNFNEKFDGIVYASFVSLGFAGIENIFYVIENGSGVGLIRAFTAVPLHALVGIFMGYQIGLAKFVLAERRKRLWLAFFIPFLFHGIYDFLLLTGNSWALILLLPFVIYLWIRGFKRMKKFSEESEFRK